jgi:hypothetical protein
MFMEKLNTNYYSSCLCHSDYRGKFTIPHFEGAVRLATQTIYRFIGARSRELVLQKDGSDR